MNNKELIFLKPCLLNKIWGGKKLEQYGCKLNSNNVGEALIVSALENNSSSITNKEYENIDLKTLFENKKELFNNYQKPYPILTKIIDANDDLSVQVHPDNDYASIKENSLGKTECWYILDAIDNAKIVYGLKTTDNQSTTKLINNNEWDKLLNFIEVKKGDFIFVPAGTVHAIGKGIVLYELQQSSDITYRLYDYNRLENNLPRKLNITDALNCIKYNLNNNINSQNKDGVLIDCEYFKLTHLSVNNKCLINEPNANWLEVTIINGSGVVNGHQIKKGDAFIIPHQHIAEIEGNLEMLIASPK